MAVETGSDEQYGCYCHMHSVRWGSSGGDWRDHPSKLFVSELKTERLPYCIRGQGKDRIEQRYQG